MHLLTISNKNVNTEKTAISSTGWFGRLY